MVLKQVFDFVLISSGTTPTGLEITEETLFDMLDDRQFDNKPIVFNEGERFKDYRDREVTDNFYNSHTVGFISSDARLEDGHIKATVFLPVELSHKVKYDNWQIDKYSDGSIKYVACELFDANASKKGLELELEECSRIIDDLKYKTTLLEDRIFELEKENEELQELLEELRRKKLS